MLNALDVVKWVILVFVLIALVVAMAVVATSATSNGQTAATAVKAAVMDGSPNGYGYMVHDLWASLWLRGLGGADDAWDWIGATLTGFAALLLALLAWAFAKKVLA